MTFSLLVNLFLFLVSTTSFLSSSSSPSSSSSSSQLTAIIPSTSLSTLATSILTNISSLHSLSTSVWKGPITIFSQSYLQFTTSTRGVILIRFLKHVLPSSLVDSAGDIIWKSKFTISPDHQSLFLHMMTWAPQLFPFQQRVDAFRQRRPTVRWQSVLFKIRRGQLLEDSESIFRSMIPQPSQFQQRFQVSDLIGYKNELIVVVRHLSYD